jgi:hypothetical protein
MSFETNDNNQPRTPLHDILNNLNTSLTSGITDDEAERGLEVF